MYVPEDNSRPWRLAEPAPDAGGEEQPALQVSGQADTGEAGSGDDWNTAQVALDVDEAERPPERSEPQPEIYRPDRGKVQTVQLLAVGLALAALFAAAPAVRYWNLAAAPDWARLVLAMSAMQLIYIVWMVSIPDWSTVWVGMLVFALVATVYGAGLAVFMYTPADAPLVLELGEAARYSAAGWCAAVVLLTTMMTFVCGRVSATWRRSYEWSRRRVQHA